MYEVSKLVFLHTQTIQEMNKTSRVTNSLHRKLLPMKLEMWGRAKFYPKIDKTFCIFFTYTTQYIFDSTTITISILQLSCESCRIFTGKLILPRLHSIIRSNISCCQASYSFDATLGCLSLISGSSRYLFFVYKSQICTT